MTSSVNMDFKVEEDKVAKQPLMSDVPGQDPEKNESVDIEVNPEVESAPASTTAGPSGSKVESVPHVTQGKSSSPQPTVVWSGADGRTTTKANNSQIAAMGRPKFNCSPSSIRESIRHNLLPILTISGVAGGTLLGAILRNSREERWTKREIMYVGYIGELFLNALKALIIPLIVSSLVSAIGSLDLSLSKKIGLRAVGYYMTTTVSAVILGIILVVSIHPGQGNADDITTKGEGRNVTTQDLMMDLVRNFFPKNLIQACFETYRTVLIEPTINNETDHRTERWKRLYNWTEGDVPPKEEWDISSEYVRSLNIIGLVCFATALGMSLSKLGPKGKPLLQVFQSLTDATMVITSWLIWISPLGIFFLVASMILEMEDLSVMLGQLGKYFLTVLLGIFIHGFIVLPSIYTLLTRRLPFKFLGNMTEAYLTAFATASSSGTLPVTFQCLEEKNHIDPRVTRFVIPIGATINMDGTALYEAVAAIFIAQVRQMSLSLGQIIAISITATAAAIGAAGIPQAGLVTMVMVLDVVGLPAEDVTLIIAVDWLLDRFRTMINVLGDSIGAGLVYELSKKELEEMEGLQGNADPERPTNDMPMIPVESSKI